MCARCPVPGALHVVRMICRCRRLFCPLRVPFTCPARHLPVYPCEGCLKLERIIFQSRNANQKRLEISKLAFAGCAALLEIVPALPATVIGDSAFKDCRSLRSVTLTSPMRVLSRSLFESCSALEAVVFATNGPSIIN